VSSTELRALAEKGTVDPNTLVRTESGQSVTASKIKGLFR
jgi:hypothetical protein